MKRVLLAFAVPLLVCAQTDSSPAPKLFAEFFDRYHSLQPNFEIPREGSGSGRQKSAIYRQSQSIEHPGCIAEQKANH